MKKSKFLKKSLAMLLALMLVVAMIPLSASAASPVLSGIEVTAGGNVVQLAPPTQGTNAYEGAIPNTALTVDVDVLVGPDYEVYYTRQNTTTTTDEKASDTDSDGLMNITIPANELDQYRNENRQVVIEFTVAEAAAPANRTEYTVVLTPQVAETGIQIEKFTINSKTYGVIPQLGETIIGAKDINITVPYDAAMIANETFTVRDWVWAEGSEGATATVSNNSGYSATIEPGTNQDAQGTVVHDGDTITVTNNNNTRTYTLNITPAAGFVSFTTEEGLDAVLFTETGDIAVLLPYGYTWDASTGAQKTSFTVTPEFTLDYPSTEASWTSGEAITVKGATVDTTTFDNFLKDWTDAKNVEDNTFSKFTAGTNATPVEVKLTYAENTFRTYKVYFFEPAENSEADITELTIGSETATIDQETKTIDITLPMGTDVSKLNRYLSGTTYDSAVDIDLIASNNATISVEIPTASNATISEGDAATDAANDRNRYVAFDVSGEVNATNPVSIRVTSEDGLTTQDYTLNVTVADEYVDPAITDMSLQDPDTGISYDGELTTFADGQKVYVFEVPYDVYDRNELNGWRFFWTKTVGATAVCNGEALAKSGAVIDQWDTYIPAPGTEQRGAKIEMKILGNEDYSARATSYYILINRADAKTTATIDEFALYGVPNFTAANNGALDDLHSTADIGSRFSYGSTIDQNKGTITVNVPYSVYAQWPAYDPFTAIVNAAEDSNAMVFVKANGEDTYTQVFSGKTDAYKNTPPAPTATNNTRWDLYDGAEILVLSEQAWVNLVDAGALSKKDSAENNGYWETKAIIDAALSDTNTGNFKRYTLSIDQKDAELDNDVTSIRLVDGTGWTAPLTVVPDADGSSNLIADIPYALTSDINDPETWNPVYLEYDVSDYAFVLGVNAGNNADAFGELGDTAPAYRQHTDGRIPVAGSVQTAASGNNSTAAYDGVFIDIADYLEMYEKDGQQNYELALKHYYDDGNPYFLIGRDGTVYICNGDGTNFAQIQNTVLITDYIAVSSEAMNAYTQYHLDLTVKTPNTESTFSSFYFKEYPAFRGVIDDATDTITVTLPYGSEYTYLTPVYTVSDGAIVTVDDPELKGKPLYNGYTDVNMTTTRKFTVIAENETNMHEYTVRVVLGNAFSDVNPDDWFYDNVMGAANNGYISGMGDGTFNPKGATTRAQFASMIAKAMGYDDSLAGETRFKDVPADQWYAGVITYCFDNDIISGYDDGTFQPEKTITRQEAASILKNAFNLTGNSGEKFPDDSAIAGWAKANVYAVKHSGLMKGDADTGNFRPTSTIIRAEAASILMNANRAGLIK